MASSHIPAAPPLASTFAHPGDALVEHLRRVGAGAAATLAAAPARRVVSLAKLTGLCHDVAKASGWFQDYMLRNAPRSLETRHSALGAVWALWASSALPPFERALVATAIKRHHGRLKRDPWTEVNGLRQSDTVLGVSIFARQLAACDVSGIARFLRRELAPAGLELPADDPQTPADVLAAIPNALTWRRSKKAYLSRDVFERLGDALELLGVFGAMLGVDRLDTALAGAELERPELPARLVERYVEGEFGAPRAPLDLRRHAISEEILTTWRDHPRARLFTLTSPTGSGKTLAVLRAALDARSERDPAPRIIYALPFTSIIDQNAAVLAAVLQASGVERTSDRLLVHHHMTSFDFRTDEAEYAEDGAGAWLVEGWASEIVVTTFHQLLYTLLSTGTQELKRCGRLAGAIVLLDEVQAIPLRYWSALRDIFRACAERLGTTFVLLTATRPLIFEPGDAVELLPSHPEHFQAMGRTELCCHLEAPMALSRFAAEVARPALHDSPSTLYVLNTRRAVSELYDALYDAAKDAGVHLTALSTLLRPCDRLARIREIRAARDAGEHITVVSTQLVEAGVNLSFPTLYRDLAPLDSIIQAAGRCNRNAEGARSQVHLYSLLDERHDRRFATYVYDGLLLECTREAIGDRRVIPEATFLEIATRYFELCHARAAHEPLERYLADGDFEKLAERFVLIEQRYVQSYFVCLDEADEDLWDAYGQWRCTPHARRGRQPWQRAFYERVVQVPADEEPDAILCVGPAHYHPVLGLALERLDEPLDTGLL